MAHSLILGMTESGKTTLARQLASVYKQNGFVVLVLDPLNDPRWHCDFITADQDEFLRVFWASRKCMAFLDEGGQSVGRYNEAMIQTATQGRHWGHSCHYIAQRALQLAPIVRDQCKHLFLFSSSRKVGEVLAEEWNCEALRECSTLKAGEYVRVSRFGKPYVHRHTSEVSSPPTRSVSNEHGKDGVDDSGHRSGNGRSDHESGAVEENRNGVSTDTPNDTPNDTQNDSQATVS